MIDDINNNSMFKKLFSEKSQILTQSDRRKQSNMQTALGTEITKSGGPSNKLCFHQGSYRNVPRFCKSTNELDELKERIIDSLKGNVRRSVYSYANQITNLLPKRVKISKSKRSFRSSVSISLNENNSKSLDESQKVNSSKNLNSPFSSFSSENDRKADILTPELVKKSISQFKVEGGIKREVNINQIMKNFNFKGKFKNYEFNFRNTVKETDKMIQTAKINRENFKSKSKFSTNKDFLRTARVNNKFFSNKVMEIKNGEMNSILYK